MKIVTLEGGLDPDRFIRERGVDAYKEALRGSRRQADYLIERARMQFPGASAEQKVKAMNFLLPAYSAHAGDTGAGAVCSRRGAEAGDRILCVARGAAAGGAEAGGNEWRSGRQS
ncbi:MAG: hypothetical protein WDM87_01125 [Terracidiphilus sp.]